MKLAHLRSGSSDGRRGLSLPEMLVVVAVFGILALIFVLSSQQMVVKTLVSRVRQEHRYLAGRIETYHADRTRLPTTEEGLNAVLPANEIPLDPFTTDEPEPYRYFLYRPPGSPLIGWILVSAGPDGDVDFPPSAVGFSAVASSANRPSSPRAPEAMALPFHELKEMIRSRAYDPTNGIISDGDIFRTDLLFLD